MNIDVFGRLSRKKQAVKLINHVDRLVSEGARDITQLIRMIRSSRIPPNARASILNELRSLPGTDTEKKRLRVLKSAEYEICRLFHVNRHENDYYRGVSVSSSEMTGHGELTLVCDHLRSPFNIGSVIRTAEGFGFSRVILYGYTRERNYSRIYRTSLGAEKSLDMEDTDQLRQIIAYIKTVREAGGMTVALEKTTVSTPLFSFQPVSPLMIIIGNEEFGVSDGLLQAADRHLHIPMCGRKNSFNVANAFAVCAYAAVNGFRTPKNDREAPKKT